MPAGSQAQSAGTPVRDNLNLTCTSLATMDVSFQSPSPILKSRRLIVNAPVAVVLPPACASATGTTTFCVVPLMASLPATSNLPAPNGFTVVDVKLACGNCFSENQSGLA